MPVFVVLPDHPGSAGSQALAKRIKEVVREGYALTLPIGGWLVSHEGTSRSLSDALGVSDGTTDAGVVFSVGSYWGRQSNDVWEWLKRMQT